MQSYVWLSDLAYSATEHSIQHTRPTVPKMPKLSLKPLTTLHLLRATVA